MKILEETNEYYITEWLYDGEPIYIRRWKHEDVTEIKVTDHFARCNGFRDVADMAAQTIGKARFEKLFGGVPEWIRTNHKGDFFFVGMPKEKLN